MIRGTLQYKSFDYFDYITQNDNDPLIDIGDLEYSYLKMFDTLGLLSPENEEPEEDSVGDDDEDPCF